MYVHSMCMWIQPSSSVAAPVPVVVQDEKVVAKLHAAEEKLSLMEKEKLRIEKVSKTCSLHTVICF